MKIINPANEETLAELKEDTRESVMKKFKSLKNGWRSWAEVPVQERIACIQRFDELLEKDKDELAETLTSEMGKPIRESYNELNGARSRLKYFPIPNYRAPTMAAKRSHDRNSSSTPYRCSSASSPFLHVQD